MAEPPVPADGNPSTEDPGENKPWDELFVNNPDEYFGNTNSQKESRPKIGDPKDGKYKPVNVRTGAQLDAALLILRDVRQEMH